MMRDLMIYVALAAPALAILMGLAATCPEMRDGSEVGGAHVPDGFNVVRMNSRRRRGRCAD